MELIVEENDLRARVEWLERELIARTMALTQVLTVTAVEAAERHNPGCAERSLEVIERDLAAPREGETAEFSNALREAYHRIYIDVKRSPPWKAGNPYAIAAASVFWLWDRGSMWWRRRRR